MPYIRTNLFRDGKKKAITMSYDDGHIYDEKLIEIFNKYGFKGTFHVNSNHILDKTYSPEKTTEIYAGHELSVHTVTHPCLHELPENVLRDEITEDKRAIERLCGYSVRGMSYPFGHFDDTIEKVAKECGMNYSRTTRSTNDFNPPKDFLAWHPTTHHNGNLDDLYSRFTAERVDRVYNMPIFYIWGHSYEFNNDNNWDKMEEFCKKAGGNSDVWYATNIELYDYVTAVRRLEISADKTMIFNSSYIPVWVSVDGEAVRINPGDNKL